MRLQPVILTASLGLLLLGCQGAAPSVPPEDLAALPDGMPPSIDESLPDLPEDAVDEGQRELAATLIGELFLKGSVTAPVGYLDSPASVTQPATTGELALVRLRATASDATTTRTIYSDLRGPGGAYSSMSFLTNNTSEYKALYVLRNEDLSMRVHNRPSFSGTLNAPAADVNYTFETKPIEDSSEPNDDENPASVTDRTQAKSLALGSTQTRSFYEYNQGVQDREDWYAVSLIKNRQYRFRLSSFNPRYGTWGYTLKLFNVAGTQVGSTTTIATGFAAGNLSSLPIAADGIYYLQVVGTPSTKTFGSNLFYSAYTINACEQAVASSPALSLDGGTERCVGATGQWTASVSPAASTYSWNFGGGCTPNTSTVASPEITITARGSFSGTLVTTSSCGASYTRAFTYTTGCSWAKTVGTTLPRLSGDPHFLRPEVAVDGENRIHVVGEANGTDMQFTCQEPVGTQVLLTPSGSSALCYLLLRPDGSVIRAQKLIEGNAQPTGIAVTSDGDLRVAGAFAGSNLDFDPGPATLLRSASGATTDAFCLAVTSEGVLQWVAIWGGSTGVDYPDDIALLPSDAVHMAGRFAGTVDFDPTGGVSSQTAAGDTDGFWLGLNDSGTMSGVLTIGGTGEDLARSLAFDGTGNAYLTGHFAGTCDFNAIGTTTRTSNGQRDIFVVKYANTGVLQWVSACGSATGNDEAFAVALIENQPVIGGQFTGTIDFDPGAGTTSRTSTGLTDAFLASYSAATGGLNWVNTWGGTSGDRLEEIALVSGTSTFAVFGSHSGTADFNPGVGTDSQPGPGMYLSTFETSGIYIRASVWTSPSSIYPRGLAIGDSRIQLVGEFADPQDFNPGTGTTTITPRGLRDGFVMRLNADATY